MHEALYQNLVYGKRLAYDIGWARLYAFCLVPLSLRSAWRRRVAPNLNRKVENATLKITVYWHHLTHTSPTLQSPLENKKRNLFTKQNIKVDLHWAHKSNPMTKNLCGAWNVSAVYISSPFFLSPIGFYLKAFRESLTLIQVYFLTSL